MPCKICKLKPVWKFTNQQQLCSLCFSKYFEKKVKSAIGKYRMPIQKIKSNSLKAKIINSIIKELPERKGKISLDNLNNISNTILYIIMYDAQNKLKKLLLKNQPLYFLSDKEILLYAKIKKIKESSLKKTSEKEIKGKLEKPKGKLKEINKFITVIEEKNPDIRHNIVNALFNYKISY